MDPNAHIPLSPRDFLILLVLVDGPLHGWGIVKAVEERVGEDVPIDPANLYRSMKRLQRDGIAEEAERPAEEAPTEQRRYFALTELGHAVVAAEARRLARLTAVARGANLVLTEPDGSVG